MNARLVAKSIFTAALAFGLFTVPASLVFLWGTNMLGKVDLPWLQWWLWLAYDGENAEFSAHWIKIGGGAGLALLAAGAAVEIKQRLRGPSPKAGLFGSGSGVIRSGTRNHDQSDWMPGAELRRLFPGPHADYGGVVVGEAYRVDLDRVADRRFDPADRSTWGTGGRAPLVIDPCTQGATHSIVIAGSGAFKTVSAVSTLLTWTGSAVVLDPSCELGPMLTRAREGIGHAVHCLSPETAFKCGTNVLDWIDIEDPLASTHVRSVVSWICGESSGTRADPDAAFFKSRGRSLIACLLADMLWDDRVGWDIKTMRTLRKGLCTPEKAMRNLLRVIHRTSRSLIARDLAGTLMDMVDETFSGVYANADEDTVWLSNPAYAALVSGNAFSAADITAGSTTVFLQIPLQALQTTPSLARVLVGALLNAAYQADGEVVGRILFLLDEARLIGPMAALETARDAGRKYGITLQLLYQSTGQIERQWGRDGKRAWFDSVSWRAYAAVQDLETARELQDTIGTFGVLATSEGKNRGSSGSGIFQGSSSAGRNENVHEIKRPLIYAAELLRARTDDLFVIPRSSAPIRCGRAIYFRRPEMVERVEANRFFKGAA